MGVPSGGFIIKTLLNKSSVLRNHNEFLNKCDSYGIFFDYPNYIYIIVKRLLLMCTNEFIGFLLQRQLIGIVDNDWAINVFVDTFKKYAATYGEDEFEDQLRSLADEVNATVNLFMTRYTSDTKCRFVYLAGDRNTPDVKKEIQVLRRTTKPIQIKTKDDGKEDDKFNVSLFMDNVYFRTLSNEILKRYRLTHDDGREFFFFSDTVSPGEAEWKCIERALELYSTTHDTNILIISNDYDVVLGLLLHNYLMYMSTGTDMNNRIGYLQLTKTDDTVFTPSVGCVNRIASYSKDDTTSLILFLTMPIFGNDYCHPLLSGTPNQYRRLLSFINTVYENGNKDVNEFISLFDNAKVVSGCVRRRIADGIHELVLGAWLNASVEDVSKKNTCLETHTNVLSGETEYLKQIVVRYLWYVWYFTSMGGSTTGCRAVPFLRNSINLGYDGPYENDYLVSYKFATPRVDEFSKQCLKTIIGQLKNGCFDCKCFRDVIYRTVCNFFSNKTIN